MLPSRPRFDAGVSADHHVLDHGQTAHEANLLKIAGDAHRENLVGTVTGVVLALESDPAGGRPQKSADNVEKRRLAGTVWSDQGMNLPCRDLAGGAIQREVSAEPAADGVNAGAAQS